jgi:hypothetical protein
MSLVGLRDKGAGLSRPPGDAADTIEEMLPETECPGRAVATLDVSLDTIDKGRGMNSKVSEKPTRALGGLDGSDPLSAVGEVLAGDTVSNISSGKSAGSGSFGV